jgi:hypothetical protein
MVDRRSRLFYSGTIAATPDQRLSRLSGLKYGAVVLPTPSVSNETYLIPAEPSRYIAQMQSLDPMSRPSPALETAHASGGLLELTSATGTSVVWFSIASDTETATGILTHGQDAATAATYCTRG